MAIHKYTDDNGKTCLLFMNFSGGGWSEDVMDIIKKFIQPEKLTNEHYKMTWHTSDEKVFFTKDNKSVVIHFDEYETIVMYYENAESDTLQLEKWAQIIDENASHSGWYSKK